MKGRANAALFDSIHGRADHSRRTRAALATAFACSSVYGLTWRPGDSGPGEDFNEESLYLDCSCCSRGDCRPNLCAKVHRQVREARLRKHATILRREPQRREDGDRLFSCRKAVLSKQGAHLGWDDSRRQDMDMRFLVRVPPLLFPPEQLSQGPSAARPCV